MSTPPSSPPPQAETLIREWRERADRSWAAWQERGTLKRDVPVYQTEATMLNACADELEEVLASEHRGFLPTPEEVEASIERSWEIHNHGYEQGKRVASEAALPPPPTETPDRVEALAEYAHRAWSGWMRYLFSRCRPDGMQFNGECVIPDEWREHWRRQVNTPYADLTEAEKESDRKEAREMLRVIGLAALGEVAAPAAPPRDE